MCCPEGNVQQEIQPLDLYFRSGCTKTLFGLEIDLFLLIEVQNMRTVDTVTDSPEGVLQIIRYDIDDNVKVKHLNSILSIFARKIRKIFSRQIEMFVVISVSDQRIFTRKIRKIFSRQIEMFVLIFVSNRWIFTKKTNP